MYYIDLTHTFTSTMPVFPGDSEATLSQCAHVEKDGCANHLLHTGMHVGTHIDAPAHMLSGGASIAAAGTDLVSLRAVVIDARGAASLNKNLFSVLETEKPQALIVCTGWYKRFREDTYFDFTTMPLLEEAAAEFIARSGVRVLVLDTPTPDTEPYTQHKILLRSGVYIVENATDTESIVGLGSCECSVIPMKLDADAAPARVFVKVFGSHEVPTGRYRHYKGGQYEVLGMARHSETLEPLVVYRGSSEAGPNTLWVRPAHMFSETILVDGTSVPRFVRL
ncbi:MAG: hypothetical protein RI911_445 [Candidatus Parcubacteria bacterium]|jgi:kynurenine formamidase